jgi:hypothetical protein
MQRILAAAALCLALAGVGAAQQPELKQVATVRDLMEAMLIPSSDILFNVPFEAPKDDAEWTKVRHNAVLMGEGANLLLIGSRAKDDPVWTGSSQAVVDAALASVRAATAKDAEAFTKISDQILTACKQCHDKYLP